MIYLYNNLDIRLIGYQESLVFQKSMKANKNRRFKLIVESSEESIIKLNYRENIGIFIFILIAFLITYSTLFLYFDIFYPQVVFYEIESISFPILLISVIFLPLIGFFAFLLIRSLFFILILRIDRKKNLIFLINNYLGYKRRRIIQIDNIKNVYVKENKTITSYGLKMSNFGLIIDLKNGKPIKLIGSFLYPLELKKLKHLIIKDMSF